MTSDNATLDPARVREAVERTQQALADNRGDFLIKRARARLLCTVALDSLAQRERADDVEAALASSRAQIEAITVDRRAVIDAADRDLDQLRSELEAARVEIEHRKDADGDLLYTAHLYMEERNTLQRELEAARVERERLQARYDDTHVALAGMRRERDIAEHDRNKLRAQLSTAQADAQGLREALSIFYRWMQQERTDKSRMSVDQMIGTLHRVIPEEVEKDQRQRAALGAGGEEAE
jgi:chromosome segregation ATPase